jgi:hypothetical protein
MRLTLFTALALAGLVASGSASAAQPILADWTAGLRREAEMLGKPAWRPMLRYVADLHQRATHPALDPLHFDWEEIGPGYNHRAFGHWDIVHQIIDVLPVAPEHAVNQLRNDLGLQQADGFLPGTIWMPGQPGDPVTFNGGVQGHPPLWVVAAGDCVDATGDRALLAECLDRAARQIAWFEQHRRAEPDGFFYNDILLHKWESGIDEGIRFDDTTLGAKACIDATAHVYQLYDYAARWAQALGRDPAPWRAGADRLGAFMRERLWDEQSGFFYDIWAIETPAMRRQAFEGIWPLVVGAATPRQATRVIDEWLLNPSRFFTGHPIASVGATDPKFVLRLWRGPAWNSMTYWAARACVRYGRNDAAVKLLEAALDDTARQFDRSGQIWEFYHPQAGEPEKVLRKPQRGQMQPFTDYLGHNPVFAMARLWQQASAASAPVVHSSPADQPTNRPSTPQLKP